MYHDLLCRCRDWLLTSRYCRCIHWNFRRFHFNIGFDSGGRVMCIVSWAFDQSVIFAVGHAFTFAPTRGRRIATLLGRPRHIVTWRLFYYYLRRVDSRVARDLARRWWCHNHIGICPSRSGWLPLATYLESIHLWCWCHGDSLLRVRLLWNYWSLLFNHEHRWWFLVRLGVLSCDSVLTLWWRSLICSSDWVCLPHTAPLPPTWAFLCFWCCLGAGFIRNGGSLLALPSATCLRLCSQIFNCLLGQTGLWRALSIFRIIPHECLLSIDLSWLRIVSGAHGAFRCDLILWGVCQKNLAEILLGVVDRRLTIEVGLSIYQKGKNQFNHY